MVTPAVTRGKHEPLIPEELWAEARRSSWVRVEVTWVSQVEQFIKQGTLWLDEAPPGFDRRVYKREYSRRRRAARRAMTTL